MAIKNGDLKYYETLRRAAKEIGREEAGKTKNSPEYIKYKNKILQMEGVVATPEEFQRGRMGRFYQRQLVAKKPKKENVMSRYMRETNQLWQKKE